MRIIVQALILISRVTVEHVLGVVWDLVVVCEVVHTYQTWCMPHITLMKWWDSISITGSLSLDPYTTDHVDGSSSLFRKLWKQLSMSRV